jgi:hypothetical protein
LIKTSGQSNLCWRRIRQVGDNTEHTREIASVWPNRFSDLTLRAFTPWSTPVWVYFPSRVCVDCFANGFCKGVVTGPTSVVGGIASIGLCSASFSVGGGVCPSKASRACTAFCTSTRARALRVPGTGSDAIISSHSGGNWSFLSSHIFWTINTWSSGDFPFTRGWESTFCNVSEPGIVTYLFFFTAQPPAATQFLSDSICFACCSFLRYTKTFAAGANTRVCGLHQITQRVPRQRAALTPLCLRPQRNPHLTIQHTQAILQELAALRGFGETLKIRELCFQLPTLDNQIIDTSAYFRGQRCKFF